MRIYYVICRVLFSLVLLTACQGITSNSTEEEIPPLQPVTTSLPDISPYPDKGLTTVMPLVPIVITSVPFTQFVIRTSENTPTPTEIPVAMCSPLPGTVAASIQDRLPYGNMVIIETTQTMLLKGIVDKYNIGSGESLYTLYAHMGQSPLVGLGDAIFCGQELGTVGTTGYDIVNPHLHLETRMGPSEVRFNSMVFYDTSATSEEMENYKWWRTSGDFRNLDPMRVFAEYLSNENTDFQTPTP